MIISLPSRTSESRYSAKNNYSNSSTAYLSFPLELYTDLGTENGIMVGTLFLIAVRKIETAVNKLKLP